MGLLLIKNTLIKNHIIFFTFVTILEFIFNNEVLNISDFFNLKFSRKFSYA